MNQRDRTNKRREMLEVAKFDQEGTLFTLFFTNLTKCVIFL